MMNGIAWSEERAKTLATLWEAKQLTMFEIGKVLGLSKNSIAGKISRLGLVRKSSGPRDKSLTKEQRRQRKLARAREYDQERRAKKQKKEKKMRKPWKPRLKPYIPAMKEAPASRNIPLLYRKASQCAYIVDDKNVCCGAMTKIVVTNGIIKRSSWCDYHYNRVYKR